MVHGLETMHAINHRVSAGDSPEVAVQNRLFDQWAIVDVMGHQRFIGKVTEQVIAGHGFVRVDVPSTEGSPGFTKLLGAGSIYAISPVSEEVARCMCERKKQTPIEAYSLPQPTSPPAMITRDPDQEYEDLVGRDQEDDWEP